MIYILLFIIGFLWITRDILRVKQTFNNSWFKKYLNNKYIDPEVSWVNKGDPWTFAYFFIAPFSDLFHLLGTIILSLFFIIIFNRPIIAIDFYVFFGLCFACYGGGVWLGYQLWRKILNK